MGMAKGFRMAQGKCLYPSPRVWGTRNIKLCRNAAEKACCLLLNSSTAITPWVLGPRASLCSLDTLGLTVPG